MGICIHIGKTDRVTFTLRARLDLIDVWAYYTNG